MSIEAEKIVPSDYPNSHQQEPVAWFIQYEYRHEFLWREPTAYEKNSALGVKPLYAAPVHARPVVHAVRCTYPQCQATNGCVGACSKTEPVHTSDMSEKHVHESDKDRHEKGTSQENRQVAMRRTTRDEKIVNPGVYEVPVFDCPRCGHCCPERQWVGLTDEEREQVRSSAGYNQFMSAGEYAKAVQLTTEAKLKEKNT